MEDDILAMPPLTRAMILSETESWLGTPYLHQASTKGAGCDCLGLLRGVWRTLIGPEPETMPPYSADWAETGGKETLLAAAKAYLIEKQGPPESGDVLLFRWRRDLPAKHCGFYTGDGQIIHAYQGVGVVRSPLAAWESKLAGVFAFVGVQ